MSVGARLRLQQGAQLQPPPVLVPRHQPLLAAAHLHQRQPRLRRVLRNVQGVQGGARRPLARRQEVLQGKLKRKPSARARLV